MLYFFLSLTLKQASRSDNTETFNLLKYMCECKLLKNETIELVSLLLLVRNRNILNSRYSFASLNFFFDVGEDSTMLKIYYFTHLPFGDVINSLHCLWPSSIIQWMHTDGMLKNYHLSLKRRR